MSNILYDCDGQVVTITINRPAHMNSINPEVTNELRDAVDQFEHDVELRVAILTGAGTKAFCAGMDLKAFGAGEGPQILGGIGHFAGFSTVPTAPNRSSQP